MIHTSISSETIVVGAVVVGSSVVSILSVCEECSGSTDQLSGCGMCIVSNGMVSVRGNDPACVSCYLFLLYLVFPIVTS